MAQGIEIVRDEVTGTARHDVTRRLTGSSSGGELQTSIVVAIPVYAYALIGWVLARLIVIMFFRNVTVSRRSPRAIGGPRPNSGAHDRVNQC